jgi:hypothetical protein
MHRPQRTHPSETRNWSWTTRNIVEQEGHRVTRLMLGAAAAIDWLGKASTW